jgi:hypothetical protein
VLSHYGMDNGYREEQLFTNRMMWEQVSNKEVG